MDGIVNEEREREEKERGLGTWSLFIGKSRSAEFEIKKMAPGRRSIKVLWRLGHFRLTRGRVVIPMVTMRVVSLRLHCWDLFPKRKSINDGYPMSHPWSILCCILLHMGVGEIPWTWAKRTLFSFLSLERSWYQDAWGSEGVRATEVPALDMFKLRFWPESRTQTNAHPILFHCQKSRGRRHITYAERRSPPLVYFGWVGCRYMGVCSHRLLGTSLSSSISHEGLLNHLMSYQNCDDRGLSIMQKSLFLSSYDFMFQTPPQILIFWLGRKNKNYSSLPLFPSYSSSLLLECLHGPPNTSLMPWWLVLAYSTKLHAVLWGWCYLHRYTIMDHVFSIFNGSTTFWKSGLKV